MQNTWNSWNLERRASAFCSHGIWTIMSIISHRVTWRVQRVNQTGARASSGQRGCSCSFPQQLVLTRRNSLNLKSQGRRPIVPTSQMRMSGTSRMKEKPNLSRSSNKIMGGVSRQTTRTHFLFTLICMQMAKNRGIGNQVVAEQSKQGNERHTPAVQESRPSLADFLSTCFVT